VTIYGVVISDDTIQYWTDNRSASDFPTGFGVQVNFYIRRP
jgi:hypothetical protein